MSVWGKASSAAAFHPKILAMGNEAYGALRRIVDVCNAEQTDGHISRDLALAVVGTPNARRDPPTLRRLLRSGALHSADHDCPHDLCEQPATDGFYVHDFLDYNPSRASLALLREQRAAAGRKGGLAGRPAGSDEQPNAKHLLSNSLSNSLSKSSSTCLATAEANAKRVAKQTLRVRTKEPTGTTNVVPFAPDQDRHAGEGSPAVRAGRTPDPIWDALLNACNVDQTSIPKSARGAYNAAVAQLRDTGIDPTEIPGRAANYRLRWPDVSLTPTALVRRWAECAHPPGGTHDRRVVATAELSQRLLAADKPALEGGTS